MLNELTCEQMFTKFLTQQKEFHWQGDIILISYLYTFASKHDQAWKAIRENREPFPHIALVIHHNQIKGFYVKRAVQILREYNLIS